VLEYVLKITQIEEFANGGSWGGWTADVVDQSTMLGANQAPVVLDVGNIVFNVNNDFSPGASVLWGLGPGLYVLALQCDAAVTPFTAPAFQAAVDGVNYLNPIDPTDVNLTPLYTLVSTDKTVATVVFWFLVSKGASTIPAGFFQVSGTGFTSMTNGNFLFQVQDTRSLSRSRNKTLQQYEADIDQMREQVMALASSMRLLAANQSSASHTSTSNGSQAVPSESLLAALASLSSPARVSSMAKAAAK